MQPPGERFRVAAQVQVTTDVTDGAASRREDEPGLLVAAATVRDHESVMCRAWPGVAMADDRVAEFDHIGVVKRDVRELDPAPAGK